MFRDCILASDKGNARDRTRQAYTLTTYDGRLFMLDYNLLQHEFVNGSVHASLNTHTLSLRISHFFVSIAFKKKFFPAG